MSLSKNDLRVLRLCASSKPVHPGSTHTGYIPRGPADWAAIRRLARAELVECKGYVRRPEDGERSPLQDLCYVATAEGAREVSSSS